MFVLTETQRPASPEKAEQTAPNAKENPMRRANLNPATGTFPSTWGRLRGFYLKPYRAEIKIAKTNAYLKIVPYCCLKNPSDPSKIVIATSFILLLPVSLLRIQIRIFD